MRNFRYVLAFILALLWASAANAAVRIRIDLSTQRMHVESAQGDFTWPVSTARAGYVTPRGTFAPIGMQRMHYSRKYDNAPMPHSIFFHGGYAIHGSYATRALGRPASHGCVRLAPANAAKLFSLVKAEGATISITGEPPRAVRYASNHARTQMASLGRGHGRHYRSLAYAPLRQAARPSVKEWQAFPLQWW